MRLIDADVFKTKYDNLITWVSHRAEKERLSEFVNDIQKQPTVKAIPIEWLEAQLDVFGDGFYDLRLVIKQWEKDNEIN